MRARLRTHSINPTCATCHKMFEPLGLAMENFDPVGEWRTIEVGIPIDSLGIVTDGTRVEGIKGLRDLAVRKHQMFEEVVTENNDLCHRSAASITRTFHWSVRWCTTRRRTTTGFHR